MKRLIALSAACTGLVLVGLPAAAPAAGTPPVSALTRAGPTASQPAAQVANAVIYTPNTVVIPRNVVTANLIGISPGGTFKFKRAAGPLAQLKVGSVMLLEGAAAGTVTALQTEQGELIVTTRDAPLAAIVSSGSISFSGTPDVSQAFVAPIDQAGATTAAASVRGPGLVSPAFPYVAGRRVHAASGPTLSLQGGTGGPFGYSVTAEPTGLSSLHLSGTICYGHGDICANGPASGISLEASFDGTIDVSKISGEIDLAHGAIDKLRAAFEGIKSNFKVSYTFSRGEGATGALTFPPFISRWGSTSRSRAPSRCSYASSSGCCCKCCLSQARTPSRTARWTGSLPVRPTSPTAEAVRPPPARAPPGLVRSRPGQPGWGSRRGSSDWSSPPRSRPGSRSV
jgi:hypothetical protein